MQGSKRWRILLVLLVFGLFAVTTWYYFSKYDTFSHENVKAFIGSFGGWAPLVYALLYTISSPVPFLATTLSTAGGLLFGQLRGTLYAVLIATASSLVPFSLARGLGRELVSSKIQQSQRLETIYQRTVETNDFLVILLMRLIPLLPWEVQNYAAGLTRVSVPIYLMATALGTIPGTFSLVFLGASIAEPRSWQFLLALLLNIITTLIPVTALWLQYRKKKRA